MKTKIKQIFVYLKEHLTFKDWVIIILVLTSLGLGLSYRYYYNKSLTPTVIYNTDSLEVYKNKLKEEYVAKKIYVQNLSDLKKQNTSLAQEVKNLKDNPIFVSKTDVKVRIDTVLALSDTIILKDSIYNLEWHLTEPKNYYSMTGTTFVKLDFSTFTTLINNFTLNTQLTMDIVDDGKESIRLIGKTDNPYITITNIDGVVFNPTLSKVLKKYFKQKKWSLGPMIGYGLTSDLKLRPYLGIGLSYGIFLF